MIIYSYGDCKFKIVKLIFKYGIQYCCECFNINATPSRRIFYSNQEEKFIIDRDSSDIILTFLESEMFEFEQFEKYVEFKLNECGYLHFL